MIVAHRLVMEGIQWQYESDYGLFLSLLLLDTSLPIPFFICVILFVVVNQSKQKIIMIGTATISSSPFADAIPIMFHVVVHSHSESSLSLLTSSSSIILPKKSEQLLPSSCVVATDGKSGRKGDVEWQVITIE
jgi:membrane protein YqaA with SNARE-associated domain